MGLKGPAYIMGYLSYFHSVTFVLMVADILIMVLLGILVPSYVTLF